LQIAMRVRLPAGMLREVDASSAQHFAGESRLEAWPSQSALGPSDHRSTGVTYTPGSRKGMVADDIESLLLPQTHGSSANDSLVEEMLLKAAAASPGFNSVPWDTANDNSTARDYLRSVMLHMNRVVVATDQTDADIQQMLDDPDAFIARTAQARVPAVPNPSAGPPADCRRIHSSASGLSAYPQHRASNMVPTEGRTRTLAQGTSFRAAHAVGRFEVSGLPDSPSRRLARGQIAWPDDSACNADLQESSASTMVSGPLAAKEEASRRSSHAQGRHDEPVPLGEICDKKQEQAQEMQVLCGFAALVCVQYVCCHVLVLTVPGQPVGP